MKLNKARIAPQLAAALLLGSAGSVVAFGGHHGKGECHKGQGPQQQLEQLDNISDDQRARLKNLFDGQREVMKQRREAMREGRQALRDAIDSGADSAQIQQLADQQAQQMSQSIVDRAEMERKLSAILTPEQMQQLKQLRGERRERWKEKRHGDMGM